MLSKDKTDRINCNGWRVLTIWFNCLIFVLKVMKIPRTRNQQIHLTGDRDNVGCMRDKREYNNLILNYCTSNATLDPLFSLNKRDVISDFSKKNIVN